MGNYYSDQPIIYSKDDLYNRSGFANDIVQLLSNLENNESYVVGIYAKWGFGKTSAINLISEQLNDNKDFISVNIDAWSLVFISQ